MLKDQHHILTSAQEADAIVGVSIVADDEVTVSRVSPLTGTI